MDQRSDDAVLESFAEWRGSDRTILGLHPSALKLDGRRQWL